MQQTLSSPAERTLGPYKINLSSENVHKDFVDFIQKSMIVSSLKIVYNHLQVPHNCVNYPIVSLSGQLHWLDFMERKQVR